MTQQAALIHDPDHTGLWRRVLLTTGTAVNSAAWHHALAAGQFVGNCRTCGGYLRPDRPYRPGDGPREWYPARCITSGCDYETAAPGPTNKKKRTGRR